MATNNKTDFVIGGGLQLGGYITAIAGATPSNGQLLIGDATNGRFSVGSISTSNGVTVTQNAGSIALSTNATSANTVSTLVARDSSGNFTAGAITATSFIGSAAQLTGLTSSQVTTALGFTPSGGNSTITISGDATGSGTTAIALTLANSGVTAGTYSAITVNAKGIVTTGGAIGSAVVTTALGYTPANIASPTFTGVPAVPTATAGTNTTQIASTAFVTAAVTASAGVATFNTRSGAVVLTSADVTGVGGALLVSPAFTGSPTAPTQAQFDSSTKLATTAFVGAAGMQFNSAIELNSNQTLSNPQIGGAIQWYGASGGILTLPTSASVPAGRTFYIFNQGSGSLTIALAGGSDFLWAGIVQYTTLTLIKGDSIFLMSRGTTEYDVIGGTAANKYSARQLVNTIVDDGTSALQVNGIATVTTPTAGDNTTKVATTAFVTSAITAAATGVASFNTRTGAVTLTSSDVTTALTYTPVNPTALASYATLASPALTGTPTAPTATTFDNSTTLATTAFVKASGLHFPNTAGIAITAAVTLNISQLNGWCQFQSNVIATLPPIATAQNGTTYTFLGGTTGGTVKGNASESIELLNGTSSNTITVAIGESITIAAQPGNSLWYVIHDGVGSMSLASYAQIASPTFTGIPAAPTATAGTNTTQLATTAFVATTVANAKYYDVTGGAAGSITANQVLTLHVAARTLNFPASFTGSQGYAVTAPTASSTFTVAVNGTTVGTIVFAASSHTSTFTTSSGAFTVTPGQYMTVTAPASVDTTLATVAFTLLSLAT